VTPATAAETLSRLRDQVASGLDDVLPPGDVALVDFPWNPNVGNHLMWLAAMRYLRSRGRRVLYVADPKNYRPWALRRAVGSGPILINGGAGMNDLWPDTAGLKRRVIEDFPGNPVVIMPQTVYFRDDAERRRAQAVYGRHRHLTVIAREHASLAVARKAFPDLKVALVPDLAFLLPPQRRRRPPEVDVIWLARRDVEAFGHGEPPSGVRWFDWAEMEMRDCGKAYGVLRAGGAFSRLRNQPVPGAVARACDRALARAYESAASAMLEFGNLLADRGRVFVSDRLHAHVLAVLRGQPSVVLPDAFGKNRALYDSWTHGIESVHWADSPAQALKLARGLATT
jgi:pyruvyl transferase EpsO